jgi:hypothetical protein
LVLGPRLGDHWDLVDKNDCFLVPNMGLFHPCPCEFRVFIDLDEAFAPELARRAEEAEQLRECNPMLRELLRRSFHRPCEEYGGAVGGYTGIIDLRNKTVLLVGGRTSSIPQYRSLVEVMNGTCVHHDGGQEQSMTVLQNLVPRADIIVCFLNCVSHDASKCVKKSFKSEKQRIIMLKNSGLSSFKRELEKYAS